MALQWTDSQPGNVLDLLPSWDEFRSSLKRNIKESLRHCYNSLRREGLTLELAVASAEPELGPALETFFRLHTARSGQANGVNHPDRFADPRARRFLSEVCRRLAQRDGVRVFTLHLNGRPVASRVGFVLPGCLYLYYSGFDPEWARFSVATTLVSEAIRYAIGAGLPRVHLSMGADTSKSRWGPRMPRFHAAVTVRARAQARAVHGLYSWSRSRADRLRPVGAWIGRRQG